MGDISRNHRQFLSRIAELLRPVGSTRSRGDATPKARPRSALPFPFFQNASSDSCQTEQGRRSGIAGIEL
jgi:hypothetical protein